MNRVFRLPLLPVFAAYTLGLSVGHFDLPLSAHGFILLMSVLLAGWVFLLITRRGATGSSVLLSLFFVLAVFSIRTTLHPPPSPNGLSAFMGVDRIAVEGILDRSPQRFPGGTHLRVRSERVILSDRQVPAQGEILLILKEQNVPLRLGDRIRFLCKLLPPRGFHNPGGFDYERHLSFEGIYTVGFLSVEKGWVKVGEGFKHPVLIRGEEWRDRIRHFLTREAGPRSSGIFKALVLGEQEDIPEEIREHFVRTGIAHLLAISGDHLGIVALLSYSLLLWLLKRSETLLLSTSVKKWAAGLTIPCILFYTFIAGGGISVIRAAIMVILFFLSILFQRERQLLHTLAVAAFLILIFSPPSLFHVSFQLSFIAVLSILSLMPPLLQEIKRDGDLLPREPSWKGKVLQYVKISLLVTAAASLGTGPFVALHFNRISPVGLITNLFFIPWVGFLIVPLTLLASLMSFLFYPLGIALIYVDEVITLLLLKAVALFSSLPFASLFVSTPTVFEIALFSSLLFTAVHLRKGRRVRYLFFGLAVMLTLDLVYWNVKDSVQKTLEVTFLDVGHGDSILIELT